MVARAVADRQAVELPGCGGFGKVVIAQRRSHEKTFYINMLDRILALKMSAVRPCWELSPGAGCAAAGRATVHLIALCLLKVSARTGLQPWCSKTHPIANGNHLRSRDLGQNGAASCANSGGRSWQTGPAKRWAWLGDWCPRPNFFAWQGAEQ